MGDGTTADMDGAFPRWPFPQAAVAVILTASLVYVAVSTWRSKWNSKSQEEKLPKDENTDAVENGQETAQMAAEDNILIKNLNLKRSHKSNDSLQLRNLLTPLFTESFKSFVFATEEYKKVQIVKNLSFIGRDNKLQLSDSQILSLRDCLVSQLEKNFSLNTLSRHLQAENNRSKYASHSSAKTPDSNPTPKIKEHLSEYYTSPTNLEVIGSVASKKQDSKEAIKSDFEIYLTNNDPRVSPVSSNLYESKSEIPPTPIGCNNVGSSTSFKTSVFEESRDLDSSQPDILRSLETSQVLLSKILRDKSMLGEILTQGSQKHNFQGSKILKSLLDNFFNIQAIGNSEPLSKAFFPFLMTSSPHTANVEELNISKLMNPDFQPRLLTAFTEERSLSPSTNTGDEDDNEDILIDVKLLNQKPSKSELHSSTRIERDLNEMDQQRTSGSLLFENISTVESKLIHPGESEYIQPETLNRKCCKNRFPGDWHLTGNLGARRHSESAEEGNVCKISGEKEICNSSQYISNEFSTLYTNVNDVQSQPWKEISVSQFIDKTVESSVLCLIRDKSTDNNSPGKEILRKEWKVSESLNSTQVEIANCNGEYLKSPILRNIGTKNKIKTIGDSSKSNELSLRRESTDCTKVRSKVKRLARQAKGSGSISGQQRAVQYSSLSRKKPLCERVGGWGRIAGGGLASWEGLSQLKRGRSRVNGDPTETNKKVFPIVTDVTSSSPSKSAEHDGIAGQGSEDEIWDVQLRVPPVSGASRHQMVIVSVEDGRSSDSSCTKHEATPPVPEVPTVDSHQSSDVDHPEQHFQVATRNKCDAVNQAQDNGNLLLASERGVKAFRSCLPVAKIELAALTGYVESVRTDSEDETVYHPTLEDNCTLTSDTSPGTAQSRDISQENDGSYSPRAPRKDLSKSVREQTSDISVNIARSSVLNPLNVDTSYSTTFSKNSGEYLLACVVPKREKDLLNFHSKPSFEFESNISQDRNLTILESQESFVEDNYTTSGKDFQGKFGFPISKARENSKTIVNELSDWNLLNQDYLDLNTPRNNSDVELSNLEQEYNTEKVEQSDSFPVDNLKLNNKYFEENFISTAKEENNLDHCHRKLNDVKDLPFNKNIKYDCKLSKTEINSDFIPLGDYEIERLQSGKKSLNKLQTKSLTEKLNLIDVLKPEELRNNIDIFAAKVKDDFEQLMNTLINNYEVISEKLNTNLRSTKEVKDSSTLVPSFDDPENKETGEKHITIHKKSMEDLESLSDDSDRTEETPSFRRLRLLGLLHRNRERQARLNYLTEITDEDEDQDSTETNNFSFNTETVCESTDAELLNQESFTKDTCVTEFIDVDKRIEILSDVSNQDIGEVKTVSEEDASESSLRAINQAIGHMQRMINNEDHSKPAEDIKDDTSPTNDSNAEDWDALMRDVLSNVSSLEEWMREREKEWDGERKEALGQEPKCEAPGVTARWRDRSMRTEPEEFAKSSASKSHFPRDEKWSSKSSVMDAGEVATATGEEPPAAMESPEKPAKVKNLRFKLDPDIYDFQSENGYEDYYCYDDSTERPGGRWKSRPTWCKPQQKYHTFSSLELGRNREPVKVVSVRTSVVPAGHKMVARPIGVNCAEGQRSPDKLGDSGFYDGVRPSSTEPQLKLKQLDIDLRIRLETENGLESSYSDIIRDECQCSPDRQPKRAHLGNSPSQPKRKSPVPRKKEESPEIADFKEMWNSTSIVSTKALNHVNTIPHEFRNSEALKSSTSFDIFKQIDEQEIEEETESKQGSPVTNRPTSNLNGSSENETNGESTAQDIGPISTTPIRPDSLIPPTKTPRRPLYIPRKKFVPDPEAVERITAFKTASGSKPPLPPPLTSYRLTSGVKNRTDSARKRYFDSKSHLFVKNTDGRSKFEQFLMEAQQDRARLMTSTPDLDVIEMAVRNKWSKERKASCTDLDRHQQQSTAEVPPPDGVRSSTPDDVWMSYVQRLRRKFNRRSRSLGYLETDIDACLAEDKACSMLTLEQCPPEPNRSLTPGPFSSKSEHNIVSLSEMGRAKSEHELRIEKSLQNLNLPDWYRNSDRPKTGFLLSKKTGERRGWAAVKSLTSSTTSLASATNRSRRPVRSLRTSQENLTWSRGSASPCSTEGSFSRGNAPALSLALARAFREPYLGWRARTPSSCASPSPQPDFSSLTWGGMDHTESSDTPLTSDLPVMDEEEAVDCFDETSGEISRLEVNGTSPPVSIAGEDTCDDIKNMSMDTFELHAPVTNGHHEITMSQEAGDTGNDIKDITMDTVFDLTNEDDAKYSVPAREDTYDDIKKISMDTFELLESSLDMNTSDLASSTGADTCNEASGHEPRLTNGHHDASLSVLAHDDTCDDVNNISTDTSEIPHHETDGDQEVPASNEQMKVELVAKDVPERRERGFREKSLVEDSKRKRFSYNQSIYHSELCDDDREVNGEKPQVDLEGSSQSLTSGSNGSNKVIWIESSFVGSRTTTSIVVLPVEDQKPKDRCYSNKENSGSNPSVGRPASR